MVKIVIKERYPNGELYEKGAKTKKEKTKQKRTTEKINEQDKIKQLSSCIQCFECEEYLKSSMAFTKHLLRYHKMTRKDYAKKHKTKEWIFCQNCKKEFFRTISRQQDKKYGQFCCRKCATEYTIPFVSQTFKVNVLKNHDMASKRSKKAAATRKEKDFYKSERFLRGRAKCKQTLFEHFGIFSYVFPRFSLESQELFYLIEQNLSKQLTCYYATKQNELFGTILENGHKMSGEFQVWVHGNHFCRFLDFYVKELNVCIEFDEESHEKEESIKEDIIRENDIKKALPTIKILRVKKRDFLTDRDKALRECLDFIYLYFSHKSHSQKSTLLLAQRPVP